MVHRCIRWPIKAGILKIWIKSKQTTLFCCKFDTTIIKFDFWVKTLWHYLKHYFKMSPSSFSGIVKSLSHLFYLPGNSKCFFIEFIPIVDDVKLDRQTIVARLEGLHESFQVTIFSSQKTWKIRTLSTLFLQYCFFYKTTLT